MLAHDFLVKSREGELKYKLYFDKHHPETITLPAPAFFDSQPKGRYIITREEANEYERRAEAARRQAAAQEAMSAASQYDPSYNYGYQPGYPWP